MRRRGRVRCVVMLAAGTVLAGCAGSAPPAGESSPAEVAPAADCAVRETLEAFGTGGRADLPAAPAAGTVPAGFEPVAAVECRMAEIVVLPAPEPRQLLEPGELSVPGTEDPGALQPGETLPGGAVVAPGDTSPVPPLEDVAPAPAPAPTPGTSVDVVRLEGDLDPLLQQLARPDVPASPDQACMAMFQVVPVLYLLDAQDRAVRVRWPRDACGFLLEGAHEGLAGLRETSRTTITLP